MGALTARRGCGKRTARQAMLTTARRPCSLRRDWPCSLALCYPDAVSLWEGRMDRRLERMGRGGEGGADGSTARKLGTCRLRPLCGRAHVPTRMRAQGGSSSICSLAASSGFPRGRLWGTK
jgi:hypothetical protein